LFRQKVDEQKAEIERLELILDGKVEAEKKNIGKTLVCCDVQYIKMYVLLQCLSALQVDLFEKDCENQQSQDGL